MNSRSTNLTIVVVGGGRLASAPPPHAEAVIAVDGGLDVARNAGLIPTLLVGDLDSVSEEGLRWAQAQGIPIQDHPADKDATDTALALAAAVASHGGGAQLLVLCGDATDRLDHVLGILVALGDASLACFESVRAVLGVTEVHVLHPGHRTSLDLAAGRVFSLLALHGGCRGVDVRHARWSLSDAALPAGRTLGISNESCGRPVDVRCAEGVLTVLVPEERS